MSAEDENVAQAHRDAIEVEKAAVDALRKDGTFERVRKALIARCVEDEKVRARVADLVNGSETLRGASGANLNERELVDRLREEVEKDVMGAFADRAWMFLAAVVPFFLAAYERRIEVPLTISIRASRDGAGSSLL